MTNEEVNTGKTEQTTTVTVTVEDLDNLTKDIAKKRDEIDFQESIVKGLNSELTRLEQKAMSYLKELKRDSYQSPHGTIYRIEKWRVSVPRGDNKKILYDFFAGRGIETEMMTFNSNTLNAFYKKEMESAVERGEMEFQIPGLDPPTLFETSGFRKK